MTVLPELTGCLLHPHEFTSVAYPMTAGKIYYVNFRGNISIYDDDGYHASSTASQIENLSDSGDFCLLK